MRTSGPGGSFGAEPALGTRDRGRRPGFSSPLCLRLLILSSAFPASSDIALASPCLCVTSSSLRAP